MAVTKAAAFGLGIGLSIFLGSVSYKTGTFGYVLGSYVACWLLVYGRSA